MSFSSVDRRVFVDTGAYYAAIDERDDSHRTASEIMHRMSIEGRELITTNAVLFELHALVVSRLGPRVALATHIELRASQTVVRVRQRDEDRAEAILEQYDDKDFSLTDALSFAIMERLGLRTAFAFDRHFVQFGWDIVPFDA